MRQNQCGLGYVTVLTLLSIGTGFQAALPQGPANKNNTKRCNFRDYDILGRLMLCNLEPENGNNHRLCRIHNMNQKLIHDSYHSPQHEDRIKAYYLRYLTSQIHFHNNFDDGHKDYLKPVAKECTLRHQPFSTEEVLGLLQLGRVEFQEFWSIELTVEFNKAFLYHVIDGTELNFYGGGYLAITPPINMVSHKIPSRAKLFSVSNNRLLLILKKSISPLSVFVHSSTTKLGKLLNHSPSRNSNIILTLKPDG